MKYREFSDLLLSKRYFVFSVEDMALFFPHTKKKTITNQLCEWHKKGYVIRLKKDLYELSQKGKGNEIPDLYIANKLYIPSYVSLETALSIYSIIPEVAMHVTSVTTNPTKRFENKHGQFLYFSCQPCSYTGYLLTDYEGYKVNIAEKEKALVDYIYFKTRKEKEMNFEDERFDEDILKELDWSKIKLYAELFNKSVTKRIKKLKEFAKC